MYGGSAAYFRVHRPWSIMEQNADRIRGRTRVRIWVEEQDGLLEANGRYHALLERLGIQHEFSVVPGVGHNRVDVIAAPGIDVFAFYARAFAT